MKKLGRMKNILLALSVILALVLSGCGENTDNVGDFTGAEVNIAVLGGPTGVGAVSLMAANDAGETVNSYNFTVAAANDEVVAGLSSGEFDIAAIATNVAANLYNKTSGKIKLCALNTYGVLYILESGEEVTEIADLAGRTVYATGQGANPEFVLNYLLNANGLVAGADVTVEYMDSAALVSGMAAGDIELAMLPMPAAATVTMQNEQVRLALDLTEEWDKVTDEGDLTMGCVVVRSEFAEQQPEAVAAFLTEYADSIAAVQADAEQAAELCETYGIVPKAAVARRAIPNCNLCFVSGGDMRPAIEPYYTVLYNANPAAIGGALPDEDFYFIP